MNEETINHVLWKMSNHLDNSQMVKLRSTLEESLLGHEKIDTTLNYAMVKQSNVKMAHKKLMS